MKDKKIAVLWDYKFKDMKLTWYQQVGWLVRALENEGYQVKKHKNFICQGLEDLYFYNPEEDNPCDICIYNHADISHLSGNVVRARINLFFKPTVPDSAHTTIDELGYGPFSTIAYTKPDFESIDYQKVKEFFDNEVRGWIENNNTKWDSFKDLDWKNESIEIPYKDYYLVLGQCGGDEVVTRHDFGHYFTKLEQIVRELSRISNKLIIVKLHPYTDGMGATNFSFSEQKKKELESISSKVKVYLGKSNVHNFIKNSCCVLLANSGAGFEVMMHHKPMITWGFPEYHWVTYDLRHLADLMRSLDLKWFNQELQDKFLYWYMRTYCFYDQESCDRRIKEVLLNNKI